jgi:hypothetical protein
MVDGSIINQCHRLLQVGKDLPGLLRSMHSMKEIMEWIVDAIKSGKMSPFNMGSIESMPTIFQC